MQKATFYSLSLDIIFELLKTTKSSCLYKRPLNKILIFFNLCKFFGNLFDYFCKNVTLTLTHFKDELFNCFKKFMVCKVSTITRFFIYNDRVTCLYTHFIDAYIIIF